MSDENTLYVKDDTGEYREYTPPSFVDSIPEDLREQVGEVGSVSDLAKGYVELKSSKPVIPESPDEYEIPDTENANAVDQEAFNNFRKLAHELGLTKEQVQQIIKFDVERSTQYDQKFQQAIDEEYNKAETALKEKWGTQYDVRVETAKNAFNMVIGNLENGEEVKQAMDDLGLLNRPEVVQIFELIGSKISEDVFKRGDQGGTSDIDRTPDGRPILQYPSMKDWKK